METLNKKNLKKSLGIKIYEKDVKKEGACWSQWTKVFLVAIRNLNAKTEEVKMQETEGI